MLPTDPPPPAPDAAIDTAGPIGRPPPDAAADDARLTSTPDASVPAPDLAPDRPPDRPPDRAPDAPPPPVALRINVNGPAHAGVDYPGAWTMDPGTGGACGPSIYGNPMPIAGTVDDSLFQGEMFGNPLTCALGGGRLPVGPYQVRLLFAEIYFGPGCPGGGLGLGSRVFDVRIEGEVVLSGFDIFREGGCAASPLGTGRPVVKSFMTRIADGTLDLRFDASINNGKISAIELLSAW
jgi:hypothetical protein